MITITDPVLTNLASDTLKLNMPYDYDLDLGGERKKFMYLEAVGRVICGIAPWIELKDDCINDEELRKEYQQKLIQGLSNLVNPKSNDYVDFSLGNQSLVDAAYLCQGLLRAPNEIWSALNHETQSSIIFELKKTRNIKPSETNWLLFASMVEVTIYNFTKECNKNRLYYGVKRFLTSFYKGDGMYSDGINFNYDYYNSYVIHPMLTDILFILEKHKLKFAPYLNVQLKRHSRFAEIQERLISPEGTYPIVGRTITCRFGVFNALSHAALLKKLSDKLDVAQVRSALTMVQQKQLKNPDTFDDKGWLQIGFSGVQHSLAEEYVNRGSIFHCCTLFLPLGLSKNDPFWTNPFEEWTNLKLWNGKDGFKDSPLVEKNESIFNKIICNIKKIKNNLDV